MILATQALVEYAVLTFQRVTQVLGQQYHLASSFVSDHFLAVILGVLGIVLILMMTVGRQR